MGVLQQEDRGSFDVAIVGAGPIGAACAYEAAGRGAAVAVLEATEGWGSQCADASAGWVCPSFAGPFVRRSELLEATRWLARRDSPLAIHVSPRLVPWLWTLLRRSDPRRVEEVTRVLGELATASFQLHRALTREGVDTGWRPSGLLDVYSNRRAYEAGCEHAAARGKAGLRAEPVDPGQISDLPAAGPPPTGAILYPDEAVCPPSQFVDALGAAAEGRGAVLFPSCRITYVERMSKGFRLHADDRMLRAEAVVICAGAATPLVVGRGARVPIVGGRGYAFEVPRPQPVVEPGPLVYLHEQRIAVTPWTDAIRFAGTLELGYTNGPPKARRVAGISTGARRAFPDLEWQSAKPVRSGARPCTPDGLPVVGRLHQDRNVIVAAGHAMLGLTLAPITGALVGSLLDGGPGTDPSLRALSPRRFE